AKGASSPESNPDFATIRVVSRLVLFVLRKCWLTCGLSFVTVFVIYWYCSSLLALLLLAFSLSGGSAQVVPSWGPMHARVHSPWRLTLSARGRWLHWSLEGGRRARTVVSPSGRPANWVRMVLDVHEGGRVHPVCPRRLHNVAGLFHQCGCNVLLVEYRGYGRSEGTPSEEGLYQDAQAGLDFLCAYPGLDAGRLVVFGRSLGGAVALDLAARPEHARRLLGLVVENTFCSVPEVGRLLFGWLRWLPDCCFKSQFRSIDKVSRVRVPVLFVSGLSDALVPPSMSQRLGVCLPQNCASPMKRLATFESGTHNETWLCKGYYATLSLFINDVSPWPPRDR
ncbi:unnamed protein product, partial [Ixodes hexagonus]